MKEILLLFLLTFINSCSLYSELVSKPKITLVTSVKGAQVYSSHGKLLGQTPLLLDMNSMQNEMDGEFLTLIVEKEGYLSRVIFFEVNRSLDLKIDLQKDQFFDSNKYRLIKKEIGLLQNENEILKKALLNKKEDAGKSAQKKTVKSVSSSSVVKKNKAKRKVAGISPRRKKKLESFKMLKGSEVYTGAKHLRGKNLDGVVDEYIAIQNLIYFRKFDQAKHDLIQLDKRYPNLISTINLLAYIEIQLGEYQVAKNILNKAFQLKKANTTTKRIFDVLSALDSSKKDGVKK